MHRGYVKLWRKVEESGLMMNPNAFTLFSWMLITASRTQRKQNFGGQIIDLSPGQLIYGRKMITERVGITEQTARTCVSLLEKLEIITSKPTNRGTIITIINWDTYQCSQDSINQPTNQQPTSPQPAINQQPTTKQEVKNARSGEKVRSEEKESNPFVGQARLSLDLLNEITGRHFRHTAGNMRHATARAREGYTLEDCRTVFAHKFAEWGADPKMAEYLRPETLLGTKFDSYLQAAKTVAAVDPWARAKEQLAQ